MNVLEHMFSEVRHPESLGAMCPLDARHRAPGWLAMGYSVYSRCSQNPVPEETPVGSDEVLKLMRSAPERYESVRALLRYRGDGTAIKALRERFFRSEAYRRTYGDAPDPTRPIRHPEPDGPFGWRCRVWRVDDHRWRQELELPDGGVDISASTGRMRLRGTPEGPPGTSEQWQRRVGGASREEDPDWIWLATDTFWTMYPFDPDGGTPLTLELEEMDLRVEGALRWAGREAVRLVGAPVEELEYAPEPLWWGADEYEVVVDAERGVLLRTASRIAGADIDALEVEEIHFDERFPDDVFDSREPLPWY